MECMHEEEAYGDAVGSCERRRDGVADKESAQPCTLGLAVDGEVPEQHRGHGVGCVTTGAAREVGMLDRHR